MAADSVKAASPADTVPLSGEGSYWELDALLPPGDREIWSLFCYEQGALGAEEIEEGPSEGRLRCFFRHPPFASPEEWRSAFAAAYPRAPPPLALSLREQPGRAWETAWRAHFSPILVGNRLLVRPPWDTEGPPAGAEAPGPAGEDGDRPESGNRLEIVIDPGQGFGTGWHPSTALALLEVESHLGAAAPPRAMLDVGAGSGILSIAAGLLGVRELHALDIDARAMPEIRRNFSLSGLLLPPLRVRGRPDCFRASFPLVAANLTAPALLRHRRELAGLTDRGGCLIVSGILASEWERVRSAFQECGMEPEHDSAREEWRAGRFRHGSAASSPRLPRRE